MQSARASFFLTVGASASDTRSRSSAGSSSLSPGRVNESISLGLNASYEVDVLGYIRRTVEANEASALARNADLEAARLLARATLAQSYFQLCVTDMQKRMYDDTVEAYRKSLELTQNQYKAGVSKQVDVAQAQTQLNSTLAAAIDLSVTRAQLEHAIAVLTGKPPGAFSLPAQPLAVDSSTGMVQSAASVLVENLPQVPLALPSALLERRPDVAGA
ncbi:MAG: TolC family protein [Candidatus Protistobacter heckmanni]|nr:TolC family protein [Candidatus Protistobacter heckmanni]